MTTAHDATFGELIAWLKLMKQEMHTTRGGIWFCPARPKRPRLPRWEGWTAWEAQKRTD